MRATLFFDEVDAGTVCRVRTALQASDERNTCHNSHGIATRTSQGLQGNSFPHSGSLALPEVHSVLFWWLETQPMADYSTTTTLGNNTSTMNSNSLSCEQLVMHLLVVGDEASTAQLCCSHTRMATVLLPLTGKEEQSVMEDLLTCGVVRQGGCSVGSRVVVSWLTRRGLQPGCVTLAVRRHEAANVTNALVLEGEAEDVTHHHMAPLHELRDVVTQQQQELEEEDEEEGKHDGNDSDRRREDKAQPFAVPLDSRTNGEWPTFNSTTTPSLQYKTKQSRYMAWWSACVLPAEVDKRNDATSVVLYIVVTNGMSLWRVALHRDGSHTLIPLDNGDEDEERDMHRARVGAMCHDLRRSLAMRGNSDEVAAIQRIPRDLSRCAAASGQTNKDSSTSGEQASMKWWSRWRRSLLPSQSATSRHRSCTPRRRYLAVTAVQGGGTLFTLLRWNGLLEVHDAVTGRPCMTFATGLLPIQGEEKTTERQVHTKQGTHNNKNEGYVRGAVVRMWAVQSATQDALHVFTCLERQTTAYSAEESVACCACYWSVLPHVPAAPTDPLERREESDSNTTRYLAAEEEEECVALRATLEVLPPTPNVVPRSCAVSTSTTANGSSLHILWQRLGEPLSNNDNDASFNVAQGMHTAASLIADVAASLALSSHAGRSLVQVVHATHTRTGVVLLQHAETFLCRGVQDVMALVAHGSHGPVLLERYRDYHRAYILQDRHCPRGGFALDVVEHLTSHTNLCVNDEDCEEEGAGTSCMTRSLTLHTLTALPTLQLVPLTATSTLTHLLAEMKRAHVSCSTQAVTPYMVGMTVVEYMPHALGQLRQLLEDVLTSSRNNTLAAVPRLLSEARLNGFAELYTEDITVSEAAMQAALELVLRLPVPYLHTSTTTAANSSGNNSAAAPAFFFSYSRTYILHTVCHALRARIVFLALSYIGWMASGTAEGATLPHSMSSLHSAVLRTLEMLVAAYHASRIAGAELANLIAICVDMTSTSSQGEAVVSPVRQLPWRLNSKEAIRPLHGNVPCMLLAMLLPDITTAVVQSNNTGKVTRFVVHVASALRRAGCGAASLIWATHLQSSVPLVQHYRLVHALERGRLTQSTTTLALCRKVCTSIARLHDVDCAELACALLFDTGMLDDLINNSNNSKTERAPTKNTAHDSWDTAELRREMQHLIRSSHTTGSRTTLCAAMLYAVVVLRRVTVLEKGAVCVRLAMDDVRQYLMPQLQQLRQLLRGLSQRDLSVASTMQDATDSLSNDDEDDEEEENDDSDALHDCPVLRRAVERLFIEVSLAFARDCLALSDTAESALRGRQGCAQFFAHLQNAVDAAESLGLTAFYAECVRHLFSALLTRAAQSPLCMHGLIAATIPLTALAELLVEQWYRYIASLPIQGLKGRAADIRRLHSTLGLHRFLFSRHAYAQCAGVMTNLASLMRCAAGPPRRNHASLTQDNVSLLQQQDDMTSNNETLSRWVGYVAALALQAAELIAPTAPMAFVSSNTQDRGNNDEEAEHNDNEEEGTGLHATGEPQDGNSPSPHHSRSSTTITTSGTGAVRRSTVSSPLSRGLPLMQGWSSPTLQHPSEATGHSAGSQKSARTVALCDRVPLLTHEDLPWLRRRVYQAYCEQRLWQCGSTLDCIDLWSPSQGTGVGQAARESAAIAVRRFTHALMEARLWIEAFRFARLANYDAGLVLEEWVSDLLERQEAQHSTHEVIRHIHEGSTGNIKEEWQAVMRACAEVSNEANQYMGYRRCLRRALLLQPQQQTAYEATPAALRAAHRSADPYSALTTLLEVFYGLRKKAAEATRHTTTSNVHVNDDNEEEELQTTGKAADKAQENKRNDDKGSETEEGEEGQSTSDTQGSTRSESSHDSATRHAEADRLTQQAWQVWADAAEIALQLIDEAQQQQQQQNSTATQSSSPAQLRLYTAGVLDPVVALAQELLHTPSLVQTPAAQTAQRLLQRLSLRA